MFPMKKERKSLLGWSVKDEQKTLLPFAPVRSACVQAQGLRARLSGNS